jgi:hypothetical protein
MERIGKLIIRNDDVNPSTNPSKLGEIYGAIHAVLPDAEIWSCITVFGGKNPKGSVYADVPFKDKDVNWFYKHTDCVMPDYRYPLFKVASHGLFHIDHSKVSRETQEMSIIGSCSFLKSKIFVPPFNRFNQDTLDICFDNDIQCVPNGWLSMDCEPFDATHRQWYMHSWRWTGVKIRAYFDEYLRRTKNSSGLGQLQKPIADSAPRV